MDTQHLEKLLKAVIQFAVECRHEYVTREHLLFFLIRKEREIKTAFNDLSIESEFICEQLTRYFTDHLPKMPDSYGNDQLGIMTDSLKQFLSQVVVQALSSGRKFPRPVDFIIAMVGERNTFVSAIFKAMNIKPVILMRWAAEHPTLLTTPPETYNFEPSSYVKFPFEIVSNLSRKQKKALEKLRQLGLARGYLNGSEIGNACRDVDLGPDVAIELVSFFESLGIFVDCSDDDYLDNVSDAYKEYSRYRGVDDEDDEDAGEKDEDSEADDDEEKDGNASEEDDDDSETDDDDDDDDNTNSGISRFLTNLTQKAANGKIDPIVGRDKEIETCCRALLRRTKCNVLIVGDAGVGKTAIVEGLALHIAQNKVPEPLRNAEIYALDIPAIIAGTKFRGEMEQRLKTVVNYVEKNPNAILFIDELHTATESDSNGKQNILGCLKPELANGNLRMIGTTTYEDFRKNIATDNALVRRFHKLDVSEPDEETTRLIIREIQSNYAEFHHVTYTDAALDAAVTLSGRYIQDRKFPDKAIDVIDEAGAENRMHPSAEQLQVIDVPQIQQIVTNIANIPNLQMTQDETAVLRTAAQKLKNVVFGQDHAIDTVVKLVQLARAGIRMPQKPIASLLFAGPTGVGKTEIARQLALTLNMAFVRFDMSEYKEEYSISKLIGSSPGYVGYERGGLLTEAVKSKNHCVLLLDEIEKAHSAIYDLLLQVMDTAKLTDNTGKITDFSNVILIMTSNSGSSEMSKMRIGFGGGIDVSNASNEIEKTFAPEFRNRLDEIILFNPLTPDSMIKIVERMVKELETQLKAKKIKLKLSDDAKRWLSQHGYDQRYGARPMARLIQKEISIPLSEQILFGSCKKGGTVLIDVKNDQSGLEMKRKA